VSGLRVYIRVVSVQPDFKVASFYSCKNGGPVYQWRYDDPSNSWRSTRVSSVTINSKTFCPARWKSIPTSLRARLTEHYLE
jgi:hypothetical protein